MKAKIFALLTGLALVAMFTANNRFWTFGLPGALLMFYGSASLIEKYGD